MDCILKDYGIDRSAMFGGAIDGNSCRRLLRDADGIVSDVKHFVLHHESRIDAIPDDAISHTCDAHVACVYALDGFLSCMHAKRFHLDDETACKAEQYRDKFLELERYLGMSITPKSHIIEKHSCEQQREKNGIGDLDESFGERNHQLESCADRKYSGQRHFCQRETLKAKEEVQVNDSRVKIKIEDMQTRRKRKGAPGAPTLAQQRVGMRKRNQSTARARSLLFQVPQGTIVKLKELRQQSLLANPPQTP